MRKKLGLTALFVCITLLLVCSCASKPDKEAFGTVTGDASASGEKMYFPVFIEGLRVYARMDTTSVHELLQKGDRVKVRLSDTNYAKALETAPTAQLIEKIAAAEKPAEKIEEKVADKPKKKRPTTKH
jgi:hypothetical protein